MGRMPCSYRCDTATGSGNTEFGSDLHYSLSVTQQNARTVGYFSTVKVYTYQYFLKFSTADIKTRGCLLSKVQF